LAEPLAVILRAVGQHLRVLEASVLVQTEKEGRVRTCRLAAEGFATLEKWVTEHRATWERRHDRLGALLAESGEWE
jgi:DNA-binding transcriptional ArsR family regulator